MIEIVQLKTEQLCKVYTEAFSLRGRGGSSQCFGIATRVMVGSQDFGVAPRVLKENLKIYPSFYEKSFIKGTLKPKIEKELCYPFFTVFLQIFKEKKIANFSQSSLWRSYSFD